MIDPRYHLVSYTPAEEAVNRLTHGLAAVLCIPALVVMVVSAARTGDPYRIVSATIFISALTLFYTISTLYHTFRSPSTRYIFRILDHAGIFVVIAGTYTPFTLVTLRAGRGWLLFGVVWGLAAAGILLKSFVTHRLRILGPILYILLGWLVVIDLPGLLHSLGRGGVRLLLAGGVTYTVGVIFYAIDRIPFNHAIWHVFVMFGSLFHYLAVLWYVVPLRA